MHIALIPAALLRKSGFSEEDALHINVLFSCGLLVALFSSAQGFRAISSIPHFCLLEDFMGIPCPGCDVTAAILALTHFEIRRSILIQPCGLALAVTIFSQSVVRGAYLLRLINFEITNRLVNVMGSAFVAMLSFYWVFRLIKSEV